MTPARDPDLHRHPRRRTATSSACGPSRMCTPTSPRRSRPRSRRACRPSGRRHLRRRRAARTRRPTRCARRAIPSTAPRSTARWRSRSSTSRSSGVAYDETAALEPSARSSSGCARRRPSSPRARVEVASLPYVDPARFDLASAETERAERARHRASRRRTSRCIAKIGRRSTTPASRTRCCRSTEGASLRKMLMDEGRRRRTPRAPSSRRWSRTSPSISAPARRCASGSRPTRRPASIRPVRVSLYEANDRHIATVALSDTGAYVAAQEPAVGRRARRRRSEEAGRPAGALPTLHDGLWGTGLSLGMPGR